MGRAIWNEAFPPPFELGSPDGLDVGRDVGVLDGTCAGLRGLFVALDSSPAAADPPSGQSVSPCSPMLQCIASCPSLIQFEAHGHPPLGIERVLRNVVNAPPLF